MFTAGICLQTNSCMLGMEIWLSFHEIAIEEELGKSSNTYRSEAADALTVKKLRTCCLCTGNSFPFCLADWLNLICAFSSPFLGKVWKI